MDEERQRFEQWYATHALNHERDPIGSRDCGLQWVAWQAGSEGLRAELAEVRRDAERYRWLRSDDCPFSCYEQEGPDNWGWCPTSSRDLDEAIDAAMAGDSAPESAATATRLWGGDAK